MFVCIQFSEIYRLGTYKEIIYIYQIYGLFYYYLLKTVGKWKGETQNQSNGFKEIINLAVETIIELNQVIKKITECNNAQLV